MIKSIHRALVIAAHPDDEILGVGGTIPLIINNGGSVDVLVVTDGSSTQYLDDSDILERKFDEARSASGIVGARLLSRLNFPDMKLDKVLHVDLNMALEEVIRVGEYDTIFSQNDSDVNLDHYEVFKSAITACRPQPGQLVKRFYKYYVNSSTDWGGFSSSKPFSPNVFFNISKTIAIKEKAMMAYVSELREYPHPRSIEAINNTAKYFGNIVGYEFAEPFELVYSR